MRCPGVLFILTVLLSKIRALPKPAAGELFTDLVCNHQQGYIDNGVKQADNGRKAPIIL